MEPEIEQLNEVDRFIILLMGAKESEPIPGRLHLQKEIYLLQDLFQDLARDTDYDPYLFGRYSQVVTDELEELESSGLVTSRDGLRLTEEGSAALAALKKKSSKREIEKVEEFKELLNDMTGDELLAFVYLSDPDQNSLETESVKYQRIIRNRKQLAISMYRKDKISAQKAAEIAGENFQDFFTELKM